VVRAFVAQAYYIPSASMVPQLKVDDRVVVSRLSYDLHPVHRGDIVVFKAPPSLNTEHGNGGFFRSVLVEEATGRPLPRLSYTTPDGHHVHARQTRVRKASESASLPVPAP